MMKALIAILVSKSDISGSASANLVVLRRRVSVPCLMAFNEFVDFRIRIFPICLVTNLYVRSAKLVIDPPVDLQTIYTWGLVG